MLIGAGQGLVLAPLTSSGVDGVAPPADAGAAPGLVNTEHQIGSALSQSVLTAVAATVSTGYEAADIAARSGAALTGSAARSPRPSRPPSPSSSPHVPARTKGLCDADPALDNSVEMPALRLGVFQTPPDETRAAVTAAARGAGPRPARLPGRGTRRGQHAARR
ncbi:hypothetical protein ACFY71_37280 [Streptomyces cinerochromogenes]|uniref:hypothetical protein n=1 Tax=Streptomyces cinerochromogenes TaxID=66422 RepID=UPI003692CAA9